MMQRPTTFGDLVQRLAPELGDDVYRCSPVVATAMETRETPGGKPRSFWVVVHSVTDHGLKLLHASPVHANSIALRIETGDGERLQVVLSVAGSHPNGRLYETEAEFQHVCLDVASVA